MAKILIIKLLFVTVLILWSHPSYPATITIASDPWMPYTGDGEIHEGYIVTIAKLIFKESGHKIKYIPCPWVRAIQGTREGKHDAIASCFKREAPDFVFPENEQGLSVSEIFIKKRRKWKFEGPDSLKEIKIGVIKNYSYGHKIDRYVETHKNNAKLIWFLFGENALSQGIRMLDTDRIDALIEDRLVIQYKLGSAAYSDKIRSAGAVMEPEELWIGFSPAKKKSIEYARILSDGMIMIRQDGRLNKILKKFGINDWKTTHE